MGDLLEVLKALKTAKQLHRVDKRRDITLSVIIKSQYLVTVEYSYES